jgi:hypothetical protein
MMRKSIQRALALGFITLSATAVPFYSAYATNHTYWSTANPMPLAPLAAQSAVANHTGNRTSGCSSGNWEKFLALQTSGGTFIRQSYSLFCGGSTHPAENSTRAYCGTTTNGTWYANCIRSY